MMHPRCQHQAGGDISSAAVTSLESCWDTNTRVESVEDAHRPCEMPPMTRQAVMRSTFWFTPGNVTRPRSAVKDVMIKAVRAASERLCAGSDGAQRQTSDRRFRCSCGWRSRGAQVTVDSIGTQLCAIPINLLTPPAKQEMQRGY